MRAIYDQWVTWTRRQRLNGKFARPDAFKPAVLTRLDLYTAHDWKLA
jgi:hypothetical protein